MDDLGVSDARPLRQNLTKRHVLRDDRDAALRHRDGQLAGERGRGRDTGGNGRQQEAAEEFLHFGDLQRGRPVYRS
jgi:hypothetical protein